RGSRRSGDSRRCSPNRGFLRLEGRLLTGLDQVAEDRPDRNRGSLGRGIRRDAEDAGVGRLDVLRRLVAFEDKERFADSNGFAILLVPGNKHALFHVPAKARYANLDGHLLSLSRGPPRKTRKNGNEEKRTWHL